MLKSFTVSRKTWLRGTGSSGSCLRNEDDCKCCLGFAAIEAGIELKNNDEIKSPEDLKEKDIEIFLIAFPFLISCHNDSDECIKFMEINDDDSTFDSEKEIKLTMLFAKNGVEIKFVD